MKHKTYALGDVVRVTQKLNARQTIISYGVVVRLPVPESFEDPEWKAGQCYRVRLSTHSFHDFIELGAFASEMEGR